MTSVAPPPPPPHAHAVHAGRTESIQAAFESYRSEIDAHNDRRERLIKASRDVTNLSKKLIFHLHRFPAPAHLSGRASASAAGAGAGAGPEATATATAPPPHRLERQAQSKIADLVALIRRVTFQEGMARGSPQSVRYEANFGWGIEEFIEAVSFHHFLRHGTLITYAEVQALFERGGGGGGGGGGEAAVGEAGEAGSSSGETAANTDTDVPDDFVFPISTARYLLGISDLTGELMRFATNALGGGGGGGSGGSGGSGGRGPGGGGPGRGPPARPSAAAAASAASAASAATAATAMDTGSNVEAAPAPAPTATRSAPAPAPVDPVAVVRAVLSLLRQIREALEPFTTLVRDMRKKQAVTTQSLRKIEDLSYQLSIRISEFGGDEAAIREMLRRALEGGSSSGGAEAGEE